LKIFIVIKSIFFVILTIFIVSKKIVAASVKMYLRLGKASPVRSWFF
jgi:hypothetical protein